MTRCVSAVTTACHGSSVAVARCRREPDTAAHGSICLRLSAAIGLVECCDVELGQRRLHSFHIEVVNDLIELPRIDSCWQKNGSKSFAGRVHQRHGDRRCGTLVRGAGQRIVAFVGSRTSAIERGSTRRPDPASGHCWVLRDASAPRPLGRPRSIGRQPRRAAATAALADCYTILY
jgi:hypothetical protein